MTWPLCVWHPSDQSLHPSSVPSHPFSSNPVSPPQDSAILPKTSTLPPLEISLTVCSVGAPILDRLIFIVNICHHATRNFCWLIICIVRTCSPALQRTFSLQSLFLLKPRVVFPDYFVSPKPNGSCETVQASPTLMEDSKSWNPLVIIFHIHQDAHTASPSVRCSALIGITEAWMWFGRGLIWWCCIIRERSLPFDPCWPSFMMDPWFGHWFRAQAEVEGQSSKCPQLCCHGNRSACSSDGHLKTVHHLNPSFKICPLQGNVLLFTPA